MTNHIIGQITNKDFVWSDIFNYSVNPTCSYEMLLELVNPSDTMPSYISLLNTGTRFRIGTMKNSDYSGGSTKPTFTIKNVYQLRLRTTAPFTANSATSEVEITETLDCSGNMVTLTPGLESKTKTLVYSKNGVKTLKFSKQAPTSVDNANCDILNDDYHLIQEARPGITAPYYDTALVSSVTVDATDITVTLPQSHLDGGGGKRSIVTYDSNGAVCNLDSSHTCTQVFKIQVTSFQDTVGYSAEFTITYHSECIRLSEQYASLNPFNKSQWWVWPGET